MTEKGIKIAGIVTTVVGAALSIVGGVVSEKKQDLKTEKAVEKYLNKKFGG